MTDTTLGVSKRTSPDGSLTQFGVSDDGYFVVLAEFPAESYAARVKAWQDANQSETTTDGSSSASGSDTTTTPPQA